MLRWGHIIAADRHNKQHSLNAVKAAEPLPPLTPLASDIIQPVNKQNKIPLCFCCLRLLAKERDIFSMSFKLVFKL